MIIAVNTRVLPDDYPTAYRYFIYETLKRITRNNPEHQFIFITDRQSGLLSIKEANVKQVVTGPAAKHPLLWKFWFDIKLPALLRKYKADIFISCDGMCSLTTKVQQCLVLQDTAFLEVPSFLSKKYASYYQKNTAKFLNKAKSIIATSVLTKEVISASYNVINFEIDIVYNAVNEKFQPITNEEKIIVKEQYAGGREFFLYTGDIHPATNLLKLLKAFSVFKKRQQTGMKLVLVGKVAIKYQSFKQDLKSYKYRNDVVLLENVEEDMRVKIVGAAYGLINPSVYTGFVPSVLQAMKCSVPVITSTGSCMQEMTEGAALYVDVSSHTDIADKMMLLYKDEKLHKELAEKGKLVAEKFTWDRTADLLWQSVLKACK
jgi:glycosyltransferase involved in cell wall biosynthesis